MISAEIARRKRHLEMRINRNNKAADVTSEMTADGSMEMFSP
jgi:hypothetical protein